MTDLPHNRNRTLRARRTVRFADNATVYVFKNHCETHKVARHVLWYTESEYDRMKFEAETSRRFRKLASSIQGAQRSSVSVTNMNQLRSLALTDGIYMM